MWEAKWTQAEWGGYRYLDPRAPDGDGWEPFAAGVEEDDDGVPRRWVAWRRFVPVEGD